MKFLTIFGLAVCLMTACTAQSKKFDEHEGTVSMEAENATEIVGWKRVSGNSGDAMQDVSERKKGWMYYNVRFTRPGRYFVHLYCLAPGNNTSKNDCYVKLDDEKLYSVADPQKRPDGIRVHSGTFAWTFLPKGPGSHTPDDIRKKPVYADVKTAGDHVFKIISRSKEFTLDKIVLKLEDQNAPQGLGPAETLFSVIDDTMQNFVKNYGLLPNYPNPFKPVTNIDFIVPREGRVQLAVYDVLGRRVRLLLDKKSAPGTYHLEFNAGALPSGTYFCRLHMANRMWTNRMVLLH